MAKKQGNKKLELDPFDFDDEFNFPDFDMEPKPPATKREAVGRIVGGVKDGVLDGLKSPAFFQGLLKHALPRGYGMALEFADQSAGTIKELASDAAKELKPALQDLAKTTEKLMPSAEKYMSADAKKKVLEWSERTKEKPGQVISKDTANDFAVVQMLADLGKFNAESDAKRSSREVIREQLSQTISQERHRDQLSQLDGIRNSVAQLAAYQRKVEFGFHRKSLELQMRHYFVAAESLNEQKRMNVRTTERLDAVVMNTSLPDFVKMKKSEQFIQLTQNKFMNSMTDGLFTKRLQFISNLGKAAKEQTFEGLRAGVGGFRDALGGLEMAVDTAEQGEAMGMDKYRAGGHMIGGAISNKIAKVVGGRLGNHLQGPNSGNLGKKVRKVGNALQYGVENAPQLAEEYSKSNTTAEEYADSFLDSKLGKKLPAWMQTAVRKVAGVAGNPLVDFSRETIRRAGTYDTGLKEGNMAGLNEPAVFNNQARRSLTEIIPGYLARIHQEIRILRTGDTSTDMVEYNFAEGKFDTSSGVKKTIFNNLVNKDVKAGLKRETDSLTDSIDPEKGLSEVQRRLMANRFLNDNLTNKTGDISRYASPDAWQNTAVEKKHAERLAAHFKKLADADPEGVNRNTFSGKFNQLGSSIKDPRADIQTLLDSHHRPHLEEMGILKPGDNNIDMLALYKYYAGKKFSPTGTKVGSEHNLLPGPIEGPKLTLQQQNQQHKQNNPAPTPVVIPELNLPSLEEMKKYMPSMDGAKKYLPSKEKVDGYKAQAQEQLDKAREKIQEQMGDRKLPSLDEAKTFAEQKKEEFRKRMENMPSMSDLKIRAQSITVQQLRDAAVKKAEELREGVTADKIRSYLPTNVKLPEMKLPEARIAQLQETVKKMQKELEERRANLPDMPAPILEMKTMFQETQKMMQDQIKQQADKARTYAQRFNTRNAPENEVEETYQPLHRLPAPDTKAHSDHVPYQGFDLSKIEERLDAMTELMKEQSTKPLIETISDTLLSIQERLDNGILTTQWKEGMKYPAPPAGAGGNGKRRLLSRLNFRISDMAKGAFNLAKGAIKLGGKTSNFLLGGGIRTLGKMAGFGLDVAGNVGGATWRRMRGFLDVYVGNEKKPRLYARLLQEGGQYFNADNGKPIRRFADITGAVKNKAGQEIMSADELKDAWVREGIVKKSLKAAGATIKTIAKVSKNIAGGLLSTVPIAYKAAWMLAKKAWGLTDLPQDIFVKGDTSGDPAMTARLMRAGSYISATTGKVIKKPSQIDGPVIIGSGGSEETVLTHDDIRKGLVDKNGQPIRTGLGKLINFGVGMVKKTFRMAKKVSDFAWNGAKTVASNALKIGKTAVNAGIGVAGFTLDRLRGKPLWQGRDQSSSQSVLKNGQEMKSILEQIRDILDQRLPERKKKSFTDIDGDGIREGSYDDLQAKKKKAKEEEDKKKAGGAEAAKSAGMFGGLKALFDKLRGKKKEGDEDEGGDTNINVDGGGGDGKKKPKPGEAGADRTSKAERRKRRLARLPAKGWKAKAMRFGGKGLKYGLNAAKFAAPLLLEMGLGGSLTAGAGAAVMGGLGTAATAVGGALATAGAAVASVVSAPVLIAAAAIAAIGIGGYYGYKYLTKKRLGILSRLRYVQYGFKGNEDKYTNEVFGLEDKLKAAVVYAKEGAKLDDKKVDTKKLMDDFDVDAKKPDEVERWLAWFGGRFKPVFLTHVTALKATAPADKWLSDVDGLEPAVMRKYFEASKFTDGPYGFYTSPFKKLKNLETGGGDVSTQIKATDEEIAKKEKETPASKSGAAAGGAVVAGAAAGAVAKTDGKTPGKDGKPADAAGAKPLSVNAGVLAAVAKGNGDTSGLAAKGGQTSVVGSAVVLDSMGTNRVSGVDAVRFKTYGLMKMEADKVKQLLAVEREVIKGVGLTKGVAGWSGSLEEIMATLGPSFGIDVSNDERTKAWLTWFNRRFLPTFLNYVTAMFAQTGKDNPEIGKEGLKASQMVDVASAIYTTSSKGFGMSSSVWSITDSPWDGYELNTDVKSTDANMAGMKEMAKNAILTEAGMKAEAGKKAGGAAAATAAGGPGGKPKPKTEEGFFSRFGSGMVNFFKKPPPGAVGGDPIPTGSGNGSSSAMVGGREIEQPGKGTDGDINAIPKPKGNKSWAALKDTILAAAKMVGVDGRLMTSMAAIESGFNHEASAFPASSAKGLYQFLNSTWATMLKRYGAKYGIDPSTPATDPRANALMGAEFIKENTVALQKSVKRPLTDTDLYLAHFLGAGGARQFLAADPETIGASLMPAAASANPGIFRDKNQTPLTTGQIYNNLTALVRDKAKKFGVTDGGEEMTASSPAKAAPTSAAAKIVGGVVKPASNASGGSDDPAFPPQKVEPVKPEPKKSATAKGIGASTETTPAAVAAKPTEGAAPTEAPSAPAVSPMRQQPASAMAGFNSISPPTPVRDLNAQANVQREMKLAGLEELSKTATTHLEVSRGSLTALQAIQRLLESGALKAQAPAPAAEPQQSNGAAARTATRAQTAAPRSPVSMGKPSSDF